MTELVLLVVGAAAVIVLGLIVAAQRREIWRLASELDDAKASAQNTRSARDNERHLRQEAEAQVLELEAAMRITWSNDDAALAALDERAGVGA